MRVLWLTRRNLTRHPGGDTTQILNTAAALRRRGVQVELYEAVPANLAGFDCAHLFHLDRVWENLPHARRLRAAGLPYVLSTIWWPGDEFDCHGRSGFQGLLARSFGTRVYENLRLLQRSTLDALERGGLPATLWRFRRAVREVLVHCAALLPNSRAEQQQIERHFGTRRPAVVVPNAADTGLYGRPRASAGVQRAGVLCVGRIEPRKNQLALIEALRDTGIPLTLVGAAGRFSRKYLRECLRAAGPNVTFSPARPPRELKEIYGHARVHACVSWYETPGLASLEAALCGCALVVTPGGCTREYFDQNAEYARPDDPASIRAAVETALRTEPSPRLAERIARDFTWDAAAAQTESAYTLACTRTSATNTCATAP